MSDDKIHFACQSCRKRLKVAPRHAGAKTTCPRCGTKIRVPAAGPETTRTMPLPLAPVDVGGEPPIEFRRREPVDEGLDMTPMVDVTFLLLIFFMVTAAFAMQKSLEVPPPDQQEGVTEAPTIEELEQNDDFVIVRIDADSTIWVDESIANSEQEMLSRLRDLVRGDGGGGPQSLLVLADGEARHEAVVMALDAGNAVGIENVRLATATDGVF